MVKAVAEVRKDDTDQWKEFLRGLWWSGLRLGEALRLSWDQDEPFCIHERFISCIQDLRRRPEEQEQPGCTDGGRLWGLIAKTPQDQRTGPVLKLSNGKGSQFSNKRASRTISEIGRKAKIVIDREKDQFATAHDGPKKLSPWYCKN